LVTFSAERRDTGAAPHSPARPTEAVDLRAHPLLGRGHFRSSHGA